MRLEVLFSMYILLVGQVFLTEYRLKLISLEKCKLPESIMYKNAPLEYTLSARKINRNTAVISTKFTIFEKDGPVFLTVRGYQVQQSTSKDLIFNLEKVTCKNPISASITKTIDLKMDNNCFVKPGNYSADNIDVDDFKPLLTKAMIGPGKYSYDLEFSTGKGVAACLAITCEIYEK